MPAAWLRSRWSTPALFLAAAALCATLLWFAFVRDADAGILGVCLLCFVLVGGLVGLTRPRLAWLWGFAFGVLVVETVFVRGFVLLFGAGWKEVPVMLGVGFLWGLAIGLPSALVAAVASAVARRQPEVLS